MNPKGSVTPVVTRSYSDSIDILRQSLVKVTFLLITAKFKFVKMLGDTGWVFEGLPIATKATFSPPN